MAAGAVAGLELFECLPQGGLDRGVGRIVVLTLQLVRVVAQVVELLLAVLPEDLGVLGRADPVEDDAVIAADFAGLVVVALEQDRPVRVGLIRGELRTQ